MTTTPEKVHHLTGITRGHIVRREWLQGEGPRITWSVVWDGEERATYPRLVDAVVDLRAWQSTYAE